MNTLICTIVFYAAIFGLFILADFVSRRNPRRLFYGGIKPKDSRKLLFVCIGTAVATLFIMRALLQAGVGLEYFMLIPYLLIFFEFGRGFSRSWKYPKTCALAFSLSVSFLWLLYPHWLVLDMTSLLAGLAMLVMFGNLTFKQCAILSAAIVVFDVLMVFGVGAMQEVALGAMNTPAVVTVPDYLTSGPTVTGLGDIVLPGIVVLVAFKKARELQAPLLGYLTAVGYLIGSLVVDIIIMIFHYPQPATLYLLPAVLAAFVLTARFYGISFSSLWYGKS